MRQKALFLLGMMLFLFASPALAATAQNVEYNYYYQSTRNEYRVDYWNFPSAATDVRMKFVSAADGSVYENVWTNATTGIMFLTCNGTYDMFLQDSSGAVLASITGLDTSSIVNGSCSSYPDGGAKNDLSVQYTDNGDGTWDVTWNGAGSTYDIYKDGQLLQTVDTTGATLGAGSYTIVARDSSGNSVGESDFTLTPGSSGGGECAVCDKITELLACPGWNEILNDLDGIIPDAPNWDEVADKIGAATVSHLKTYFGDVPAAPTAEQIEENTPFPVVEPDISVEQLEPSLPAGYEQPIPFDISSGEQIQIVDESQPFLIEEPLNNVPHDEPGTAVIPGDDRNSSEGIKAPESPVPVYVGTEIPVPTTTTGDDGTTPAPIPNGTGDTTGPEPGGAGDMTGPEPER